MAQDSSFLVSGRGWGNVLYIYHSPLVGQYYWKRADVI